LLKTCQAFPHLCFFVLARACPGELALTRPASKYLAGLYVALAFGGMLGGLFPTGIYRGLVERRLYFVTLRVKEGGGLDASLTHEAKQARHAAAQPILDP
jgi:hypothetical protein